MRWTATIPSALVALLIATGGSVPATAPASSPSVPTYLGLDAGIIPGETRIPAGFNTREFTIVNQYSPRPSYVASSTVKICNRDVKVGHVRIEGTPSSPKFAVQYFTRTREITDQVTAGTYRTRFLRKSACARIFLRAHVTRHAQPDDQMLFVVKASAQYHSKRYDDRVGTLVHDQRPPETPVIVISP
jgi:hypothetical protein